MKVLWLVSNCLAHLQHSVAIGKWASPHLERFEFAFHPEDELYVVATWWVNNRPTGKVFGIAKMLSKSKLTDRPVWPDGKQWGNAFPLEWKLHSRSISLPDDTYAKDAAPVNINILKVLCQYCPDLKRAVPVVKLENVPTLAGDKQPTLMAFWNPKKETKEKEIKEKKEVKETK